MDKSSTVSAGRRRGERLIPMHGMANLASSFEEVTRELKICSAFVKQRFSADGELIPMRSNGPRRECGRPLQRRVIVDVGF